jgi:HPt (histidine-containing phosphotransfer) domain-containing protein
MNEGMNSTLHGVSQTEAPRFPSPVAWTAPEVFGDLLADGSGEVVIQLIEAFRSDTAERLQRLGAAFASQDYKPLREEAHTIRGAAQQIGADAMAKTCQEIESAQVETQLIEIGKRIEGLKTQFAEVCENLTVYANHLVS